MVARNTAVLAGKPRSDEADSVEQQLVDSAVHLLPIAAGAVFTAGADGRLRVAAASCGSARRCAQIQVEDSLGAAQQVFRSGVPSTVPDLRLVRNRWPAFVKNALSDHYRSMLVLPLCSRGETVGVVVFFCEQIGALPAERVTIARGLADIAATGIVQERTLSRSVQLNRQLQAALDSRIVIEQAKGVLSERGSIDMGAAFNLLRSHARKSRQSLTDLARAVVNGADTSAILSSVA